MVEREMPRRERVEHFAANHAAEVLAEVEHPPGRLGAFLCEDDGAILAFKVEEKAGKFTLSPAWISREMNRAEPPVIANGIIFAYGSGEDTDQAAFDIGLAILHLITLPKISDPSIFSIASAQSSSLSNSTKPKPLDTSDLNISSL